MGVLISCGSFDDQQRHVIGCESLCGCMSKSEEPSEQSEDGDPPPPQEQQTASKTAKSLAMLDSTSKSNLATVSD